MASIAVLHAALVNALKALPTVRVHDGHAPDDPARDAAGRVYPYAVVWGNPGHTDEDSRNAEGDADGALAWRPQITVAAGDLTWLLQAVDLVRVRVDGLDLDGAVLREEPVDAPAQRDPDLPDRWFVPLYFTTLAD